MNPSKVAIVTVNYKTGRDVVRLMETVRAERRHLPNLTMYVVDNASGDDSFEVMRRHVEQEALDWVRLIAAAANGGFSAGNNLALRPIAAAPETPDFVWLLNPDTMLRDGAGLGLVEFLQKRGVHLAGSRLEDADGTPQVSSFNFPGVISELCGALRLGVVDRLFRRRLVIRPVSDVAEPCGWLAGASLMMSWQAFAALGPMDENYFLYFEEVDYCLQARRRGMECWYVPESRVFHRVGASTGISETRRQLPRIPQYWFDSRRRYFLKNHGALFLVLVDTVFAVGYSLWLLRRSVFPGRTQARPAPHFLRDFLRNSYLFRGFRYVP